MRLALCLLLLPGCFTLSGKRVTTPSLADTGAAVLNVRFFGLKPSESDLWVCGAADTGDFVCVPFGHFHQKLHEANKNPRSTFKGMVR
jgi:hypothetical protein